MTNNRHNIGCHSLYAHETVTAVDRVLPTESRIRHSGCYMLVDCDGDVRAITPIREPSEACLWASSAGGLRQMR